jgi:hypothetical protein
LYQLTQARAPAGSTLADQVAAFLEWAITTRQEGFERGEIISIGALATGLGRSRNTAAKSVEQLVAKGMLARTKLKSPYEIVSSEPIFKDASLVADEQISLTMKMDSVRRLVYPKPDDPFAAFLVAELAESSDGLIREAAVRNWTGGEVLYYLRMRSVNQAGGPIGYLAEVTFLNLTPEQSVGFSDRYSLLLKQQVSRFSMYSVLEQCGLSDLRAGRTQVAVGSPPGFLARELREFIAPRGIDMNEYEDGKPMLKWSYALFQPSVHPMATFSVCFVRPDLIGIFIRKLDVELR